MAVKDIVLTPYKPGQESENRFVTVKLEHRPKGKRSFTPEEQLSLLQGSRTEGYMETCRKYNLSPALLQKHTTYKLVIINNLV